MHVEVTLISHMDPSYSQEGLPVLNKVDHVVASSLFDPGVDQFPRKADGGYKEVWAQKWGTKGTKGTKVTKQGIPPRDRVQ